MTYLSYQLRTLKSKLFKHFVEKETDDKKQERKLRFYRNFADIIPINERIHKLYTIRNGLIFLYIAFKKRTFKNVAFNNLKGAIIAKHN